MQKIFILITSILVVAGLRFYINNEDRVMNFFSTQKIEETKSSLFNETGTKNNTDNGMLTGNGNSGIVNKDIAIPTGEISETTIDFTVTGYNLSFSIATPTIGGLGQNEVNKMPLTISGDTINFCGGSVKIIPKQSEEDNSTAIKRILFTKIHSSEDCKILTKRNGGTEVSIISNQKAKTLPDLSELSNCPKGFFTVQISESDFSTGGNFNGLFYSFDSISDKLFYVLKGQDPVCGSRRENLHTVK